MTGAAMRAAGGATGSALLALAVACSGLGDFTARVARFEWLAPRSIDRSEDAAPTGAEPPRTVLLVSIDGLAANVLARTRAPTLERLAREGRAATRALTVMPSLTLPAHASMLSGRLPDAHGVTWNRYSPFREIEVPTVFTACAESGLRCGIFAGKRKLAHFAEDEPGVERFECAPSAAAVLAAAERYLRERAPDFVFVHLAEVDLAGHQHGWSSSAQRAALGEIDALLGAFLERAAGILPRPLAVIVTSDHGGVGYGHGSDFASEIEIPWIAWGDGVAGGEPLAVVDLIATAPTVLHLLGLDPPPGFGTPLFLERPGEPEPPLVPAGEEEPDALVPID